MTHSSTTDLSVRRYTSALLVLLSIGWNIQALAADAGRFLLVIGDVRVVSASGQTHPAVRGSPLSAGDTVFTGDNALAQLSMVDDGRISLRENTEFKLEDYNFERDEPSLGRMFVNLLRGSFRSITGLIGQRNRSGYRIRTPHATIGVRGTDHETTVLLTARDGFAPGTFDVVFEGGTIMRTQRGQIEISAQQAGYVGAANALPEVIEIPAFLVPTRRVGIPAPRTGNAQGLAKRADTRNDPKQVDSKAMLLNPLSDPKLTNQTRTMLARDLNKVSRTSTLQTLGPTILQTPGSTTLPTLDSMKLQTPSLPPLHPPHVTPPALAPTFDANKALTAPSLTETLVAPGATFQSPTLPKHPAMIPTLPGIN